MQFQIVSSCPLRVVTCGLEDRGFVILMPRFSVSQLPSNRPNTPQAYSQQGVPAQPFHLTMEQPDRTADNPFLLMLGDCLSSLDGLLVRWLSVGGTVKQVT